MNARLFRAKNLHIVLTTALLVGLAMASLPTAAQQTARPAIQQGRKISLRDQLTLGLRAHTKADKAFVEKVVLLVQQNKLPRQLVDSTFLWARQRAVRHSRSRHLRPIVYFQPGLVQRAKRFGVML